MDAFEVYRTGAGVTVLPRVVARVSGTDPLAFLEDTTTQDLADLKPGSGALTCLLDDKGRVLAEMRALLLADGSIVLDAEEAAGTAIFGWLARVAPLSGCEVVNETGRWTVTAVRGARAADVLSSFGTLPLAENEFVEIDDAFIVRVEWGPEGFDVISTAGLGVVADSVPIEDFESARIDAGRPRYGVDFNETTHISDTPLMQRIVSATKGCYPGQESVARVRNLGRARKRIMVLELEGNEVSEAGSAVNQGEAQVGVVTSSGIYGGAVLAMASVRAEVEGDAAVEVNGVSARVRA